MELKRQLGVNYGTAWMVKHKPLQAMKEADDQLLLTRCNVQTVTFST